MLVGTNEINGWSVMTRLYMAPFMALILSGCAFLHKPEPLVSEPESAAEIAVPAERQTPPTPDPVVVEQGREDVSGSEEVNVLPRDHAPPPDPAVELCLEVGSKLGSVSVDDCLAQHLAHSAFTTLNRSLAYKDYLPLAPREPLGRVLLIGGIHGDEFSSVSVVFKWMSILNEHHSGAFHWRFVPAANPDGLLKSKSQR